MKKFIPIHKKGGGNRNTPLTTGIRFRFVKPKARPSYTLILRLSADVQEQLQITAGDKVIIEHSPTNPYLLSLRKSDNVMKGYTLTGDKGRSNRLCLTWNLTTPPDSMLAHQRTAYKFYSNHLEQKWYCKQQQAAYRLYSGQHVIVDLNKNYGDK